MSLLRPLDPAFPIDRQFICVRKPDDDEVKLVRDGFSRTIGNPRLRVLTFLELSSDIRLSTISVPG
jgi:hypothetical protein